MRQVLSPHRFRVGPHLPPGRFRAVDTRWVPVIVGVGAVLIVAGLFLAVSGLVEYFAFDPETDTGIEYIYSWYLFWAYLGFGGCLVGVFLALWGWLRRRASKVIPPVSDPPSVAYARWSGRSVS